MEREVVLSKTAEKKLRKLFDFLAEEWSEKVKNEFIKKLDFSINRLKNNQRVFQNLKHKKD